jgi:hypothetical protein
VYRGARLYREFRLDEPWDSPHNEALLKEMPDQYGAVAPERWAPYLPLPTCRDNCYNLFG